MGACGLVRARKALVTRGQAQLIRLLLICAAWAIGQTLVIGLAVQGIDFVVPAALAVGVYLLTLDLGRPRSVGADAKYWRGRRIDEDQRGRGRWN